MQDVATWQAAMEGSRPGPVRGRSARLAVILELHNLIPRRAVWRVVVCMWVSAYGDVGSHVSVTTRHLLR
jgi:hypothetical protein